MAPYVEEMLLFDSRQIPVDRSRSMEPSNKRIHAAVDPSRDQSVEPLSKRIRAAADDRLSDLPDCLVHSILSFLDSWQVVRSSVLSRRWRHLWRSVPCLDIDQTLFYLGVCCPDVDCRKRKRDETWTCNKEWWPFEEFSNNLLLLNSAPSLEKLRIHVPTLDYNDTQAVQTCLRWIRRGVECSPTVIDIHMDIGCHWTWCLLDLGSSSSRLTRLLLHGVKLDGSFEEHLRSGYPVLEDLHLVRCSCHFGEIMSRMLRHLTMDDCFVQRPFEEMVVTTPRLSSLHTSFSTASCPNGIHVRGTSSFVKSSICVISFAQMNASFCEKLCNIFNVKHLELFGAEMMDEIQWMSDELPKFHNVRTLLIDRCDLKTNVNIQALDRFLQSVPGLEKLTLQNCEFIDRSKRRSTRAKWRNVALESQNLMSFKCNYLEVIEIKHSKDENVHEFFELLMGLWKNLGNTNIKITKV